MDEHMVLLEGRSITVEGGFVDDNMNNLTFFTDKHNKYATREAIDVLVEKYNLVEPQTSLSSRKTSAQASIKRWFKIRVYNRLPILLGTMSYFLFRYLIQLGYLDGREGQIYHFLQGFLVPVFSCGEDCGA